MVHFVSGWTRGGQVKLWDPLRTRAIPECLRGLFTTTCYTNPRLPLPYISWAPTPLGQWWRSANPHSQKCHTQIILETSFSSAQASNLQPVKIVMVCWTCWLGYIMIRDPCDHWNSKPLDPLTLWPHWPNDLMTHYPLTLTTSWPTNP